MGVVVGVLLSVLALACRPPGHLSEALNLPGGDPEQILQQLAEREISAGRDFPLPGEPAPKTSGFGGNASLCRVGRSKGGVSAATRGSVNPFSRKSRTFRRSSPTTRLGVMRMGRLEPTSTARVRLTRAFLRRTARAPRTWSRTGARFYSDTETAARAGGSDARGT